MAHRNSDNLVLNQTYTDQRALLIGTFRSYLSDVSEKVRLYVRMALYVIFDKLEFKF